MIGLSGNPLKIFRVKILNFNEICFTNMNLNPSFDAVNIPSYAHKTLKFLFQHGSTERTHTHTYIKFLFAREKKIFMKFRP